MTTANRSLRLTPATGATLDKFNESAGEFFYDSTAKTIRLFTGVTRGGEKLATRAWVNSTSNTTYAPKISPTFTGTVTMPVVTNIKISGGTNGQVVQTDGAGNLTWGTVLSLTEVTNVLSNYLLVDDFETTVAPYFTTYATQSYVSSAISSAAYTLPQASTSVLGGVKIDGTSIQWIDGKLSATPVVGAAAANSLTGNTLATSVVNSNLTSVGTLTSLTVTGTTTLNNNTTVTGNVTASGSVAADSVTITNAVTIGTTATISTTPTNKNHVTNKRYVDKRSVAMAVALS
jgi:hypothetical protein